MAKSFMKFLEIVRFECAYQLRQSSTWLLIIVLFGFGLGTLSTVTIDNGVYLNAPSTLAFFTVFGSAIWIVLGGVVAGDAATRDIHTNMYPLVYTTPASKLSYVAGRYVSSICVNLVILSALFIGFAIALHGPGARPQFLAPFQLAPFITSFLFIALPTVLATTSVQYAASALSGRAMASYIASVVILMFSQLGGTTVRFALDWKFIGSLMDLLGTGLMMEMEGWTPLEKNTRLILPEGPWLWNRIVWISVAILVLALTYSRLPIAHRVPYTLTLFKRRKRTPHDPEIAPTPAVDLGQSSLTRAFDLTSNLRQMLAITGSSFSAIARSRGGLTLVGILAVATGLFATEYMEWLGVPLFARTQEVLQVIAPLLNSIRTHLIVIPLLTIFYAGDLAWRERDLRVSSIYDVLPVSEAVLFAGKFLGLALIIAVWISFLLLAGIINQLVMGYHHFEFNVYFKALFGIQLTNYLLFALLVFVIHVLVNQKYVGYIVALIAYGFILFSSMIGVEHNLLIFGSDPGWRYSDMSGFSPFMKAWIWFKMYWISWSLLLALAGILCWVRSKETSIKCRINHAKTLLPHYRKMVFASIASIIITGGFIFYNTNIQNQYLDKSGMLHRRAEYERKYGQFQYAAQPVLAGVSLNVDIHPKERSFAVKGRYSFLNNGSTPIESIHLSTVPLYAIEAVVFDRPFRSVIIDDILGFHIYGLNEPLKPGESVAMTFKLNVSLNAISNDGANMSVVENGSHITQDWLPAIGYDDDRRIRDERARENHGLPKRMPRPRLEDMQSRLDTRHADTMNFEAVVSTDNDQIAVAPGTLRREWNEGDRKFYHYVCEKPIHNYYAFFSARYAVSKTTWKPSVQSGDTSINSNVSIEMYYHPTHSENIDRMMKSVKASLEYYSKEFGPYPYKHFRVLERPGAGKGMHADPMTIDYQEGYSLMNPSDKSPDLPYHIMAHEVAHQWWGYQLAPAAIEGSGLLVESFATYSAMQVVEANLGYDALMKYLTQMRREYEVPRSRAAQPLLRSNNSFLNYRKGPFALYALRNYIGKDRVNDAMRKMLSEHVPSRPPLSTTLDFSKALQDVTPDSLQYLVRDLFAENTFWELKMESVSATRGKDNHWNITMELNARKVVVDSVGLEGEIPMSEWIEIGVYRHREESKSDEAIYLQRHRITSGKQRIDIRIAEQPWRVGIDPKHLLIDIDPEDNWKTIPDL